MTVKIKRYEIIDDLYHSRTGKGIGIYDFLTNRVIISFDTNNKELNQLFAGIMLTELNTGNYEKYLTGKDENDEY